MNQKEYDLLAGAIHRTITVSNLDKNQIRRHAKFLALHLLVADLIGTLSHNYPKTFDEEKFLKACGL